MTTKATTETETCANCGQPKDAHNLFNGKCYDGRKKFVPKNHSQDVLQKLDKEREIAKEVIRHVWDNARTFSTLKDKAFFIKEITNQGAFFEYKDILAFLREVKDYLRGGKYISTDFLNERINELSGFTDEELK